MVQPRSRWRAFLDQNGEGLFAIVYGVADIEEASERARSLGWPVDSTLLGQADVPWSQKVTTIRERFIEPVPEHDVLYGQIDYVEEDDADR